MRFRRKILGWMDKLGIWLTDWIKTTIDILGIY